MGRGVPLISPWHANRKSWEEATKAGHYTLKSWSEADELEKSADFLMWLLKGEKSRETHEILGGIEKYRDGAGGARFTLYEDFASSYLGTVATSPSLNTTTPGVTGPAPTEVDTRAMGIY